MSDPMDNAPKTPIARPWIAPLVGIFSLILLGVAGAYGILIALGSTQMESSADAQGLSQSVIRLGVIAGIAMAGMAAWLALTLRRRQRQSIG